MAAGHPDTYVILMLFRGDLQSVSWSKSLDQLEWTDIRWTRQDIERADRVDFIDVDGTTRTLKKRPLPSEFTGKVMSIARPESFDFLKVEAPWVTGPYKRFQHEPSPR